MILISLLKLPFNLLADFLQYASKLESKNKGYWNNIITKSIRRWKQ